MPPTCLRAGSGGAFETATMTSCACRRVTPAGYWRPSVVMSPRWCGDGCDTPRVAACGMQHQDSTRTSPWQQRDDALAPLLRGTGPRSRSGFRAVTAASMNRRRPSRACRSATTSACYWHARMSSRARTTYIAASTKTRRNCDWSSAHERGLDSERPPVCLAAVGGYSNHYVRGSCTVPPNPNAGSPGRLGVSQAAEVRP